MDANFSEPGADNIVGLDSLSSFLQHSLQGLQSQHALGTLHVRFTGAESALAEMYLTATFFDRGTLKGQVYADNGIYKDEMLLKGEGERWEERAEDYAGFGEYFHLKSSHLLHPSVQRKVAVSGEWVELLFVCLILGWQRESICYCEFSGMTQS